MAPKKQNSQKDDSSTDFSIHLVCSDSLFLVIKIWGLARRIVMGNPGCLSHIVTVG